MMSSNDDLAINFQQKIRRSNGFYNVNAILPEFASGDGYKASNFPKDNFNSFRLALESLWKTEYHCPEVLPYPTHVIENLKDAIKGQQEIIDNIVEEGRPEEHFTVQMYQMEIERVRFLICNYAKIRIMKIQRQKEYLLFHPESLTRLSEAERIFLSKLQNLDHQYTEETIITRLEPKGHDEIFEKNASQWKFATPKFDAFVFCQALDTIEELTVSQGITHHYQIGDIFIVRYKVVRALVLAKRVQLI